EVERVLLPELRADVLLPFPQDRRLELHRTGLVDTVDVAEDGGEQVAAALTRRAEHLGDSLHVLRRGVELLVHLVGDAVLLATDDADLALEDGVRPDRP